MATLSLRNITIIRHPQPIEGAALLIEDGKIVQLGLADDFSSKAKIDLDCTGLLIAPGFIDLQCNGGFGHDFTNDPSTIAPVAQQLPQFGVTSFLPTIITSPLQTIAEAQQVLQALGEDAEGTNCIGLHIEGPYLNPLKKGAHDAALMRAPAVDEVADWSPQSGIRLVTIAPELTNAHELIAKLAKNGVVVSVGHSMATFTEAVGAFDSGIRYGTHLFNAMPPLHHREPGLVAGLLNDERLTIGIIPDGIHVDPQLIKLVWRLAKGRINVVTDAMAAMGCGDGVYQLADREVVVEAGAARIADGSLAGSVVTLDQAVRNLIKWTACSVAEAVQTVTEIPANLLNLSQKGRIAIGCDADLVLLNHDLTINKTIIGGEITYESDVD